MGVTSSVGRSRTTTRTSCTTLLLVAALLPPAFAAPAAPPAGSRSLLLFHWWTSPAETAAFTALTDVFKARYPDVVVNATLMPNRGNALFPLFRSSTRAGASPDALLMYSGYAIDPFIQAGMLQPLDPIWKSERLEELTPAVVQQMAKQNGKYYAVPLNMHRTNLVWYNKAVLAKHHIDPATLTTWDAFFRATEVLRNGGVEAPVQLGGGWTTSHLFECIVASLGIPVYEDWINGKIRASDDSRMRQAFGILGRYLSYANKDRRTIDWETALSRIVKGEAAFCVMGDWSDGEIRYAGLHYGVDYGAFAVPGTKDAYGVTIDIMVQAAGLPDPTNAERWFKVLASRDGQDAFNRLKGSIPARLDTIPSKYGAYQKSAILAFSTSKAIYPSQGAAMPVTYIRRLVDALGEFDESRDITLGTAALAAATKDMAQTYTRTWSLSR